MTTVLQRHYEAYAHVEAQGNLIAIKGSYSALAKSGGGKRGIVTEFSAQSRLRMLRKLARIAPTRVVFVTLTYPERFPSTTRAKGHLRAFLERIRRRYPHASAFWRLEYQERGAPHFHLLFFELPFVPWSELRRWWAEIITAYVDGFLPRVRIEKINSRRGAFYYCAKYTAKMAGTTSGSAFFILDAYLHVGRFWGVFNRGVLPYAERRYMVVELITWVGFQQAKAYLEQFAPTKYPNMHKGKVVLAHGTLNHFRIIYGLLRPDYRQAFIRRFDKWEHKTDGHSLHETLSLPSKAHVRVSGVHVYVGGGILRTPRRAYDG